MKLKFITVLLLLTGINAKVLSAKQNDNSNQLNISVTPDNTESITERNSDKGQILIHLSLPYISNFHFTPVNEGTKNNTGFMGYSAGLDYLYKKNRYVNFSFSQIMDYYLPVMFVDRGDEYELMSSNIFNLTNNYQINRFSVGYGILFSKNSWEMRNISRDENSLTRKPDRKDNSALGLSFSTYYRLTNISGQNFLLGLIYRPTFLKVNNNPKFNYEHSISIDIAWKLKLWD